MLNRKSSNKAETHNGNGLQVPRFINMKWLSFPYIIWMAGFIIIPLIMILYYGLTNQDGRFSLENIKYITDPVNLQALVHSLEYSILSTLICLLLAYPLAFILNQINMKSNSFIVLIIILPMWMNFLLRTIAWQNILERTGVLNSILKLLHLPTVNLINTPGAIILGMVYNFLPFMILPIYNILLKIDKDVINAARDLGASGFQTFLKIIFPLSLPGVLSGITMVFVPSLTTFVISSILGGSKIVLIGNVIEQQFLKLGNWHTGSGLSIVLMIFVLFSMAILTKYDKHNEGGSLW